MRQWRNHGVGLAISLTLHLGCYLLIQPGQLELPAKLVAPVEFVVVTEPTDARLAQQSAAKVAARKAQRTSQASGNGPSLTQLMPSWQSWLPEALERNQEIIADDAAGALDAPESYGISARQLVVMNENLTFITHVYERIDNHILYPSLFAEYGHAGVVYVEFTVRRDGVLVEEHLEARGVDRLLKHHCRQIIKEALREPFKENLWLEPDKKMRFQSRFIFAMPERGSPYAPAVQISGHHLSFHRYTSQIRVPTTLLKHLANGGLSHDPWAMYDSWQKYQGKKRRAASRYNPFAREERSEDYRE